MKITYIVGIANYHALVNRCAAGHLRLTVNRPIGRTLAAPEIVVQIHIDLFERYCERKICSNSR